VGSVCPDAQDIAFNFVDEIKSRLRVLDTWLRPTQLEYEP
jgi:hypothetical protein